MATNKNFKVKNGLEVGGDITFSGTLVGNAASIIPNVISYFMNDVGYVTSSQLDLKANIESPTFTGTVGGITATMVGLGNVTNESKATMFTNPTFTGTVAGVTATHVGLGNVNNTSDSAKPVSTAQQTALNLKANIASPTFTGTVSGITATMVGLGNVTNESKSTMFTSPTFTGTVSGVTATHVGLGNVTNESKATMFSSPTFTGTTTTGVLTVQPSATIGSVGSVPTGASIITNSNTNNYHVFRNSPDNSTYSGIVMQDNNIGGYVIYGNSGVGDKMYIAGYSAVDILVGITDNINPASRTTIASFSSSGMSVTSLTETSSIKYKENIKPISNALEQLSKLQGVIYDRIDTGVKQEAGLIAEDVFKVLPNLVQLDDEGNPMGVKYTKLTAYLIECIKELKLEIETLKQK